MTPATTTTAIPKTSPRWPNSASTLTDSSRLTYSYWPTSYNTHIFEGNLYFTPSRNARERVAHEMTRATHKEYGLQDCNTLEATQTMLESGVFSSFPLSDHEVLCRHLHKVVGEWVADYDEPAREGCDRMSTPLLPE